MTNAASWPDHLLDLDEWDALPEDEGRRVELVEGVLAVSPPPRFRHQSVMVHLAAQLEELGGRRWGALPDIEVVIEGGPTPTVRVPDIAVVPEEIVDDRPRCAAAQLLAVFEVLSPGTTRVDRVLKLHEYALAGVPLYGIVDVGPPVTLTEFRLVEGVYERVAEHRGHAALGLGVTVDLEAL